MPLLKIGHEVLTAFCEKCKCCLATDGHCGTCHVTKTIERLCGCGNCPAKAHDYLEREKARQQRIAAKRAMYNAIYNL